jgi:uncharacterized protein (TIGR02996 family)
VNERDAFLKALAENEDDLTTRLVYADWLDEHGEHEEADRQRKWPAAKEWLVQFCRDNNPSPDVEDPYETIIPYEELLERGRQAVEEAGDWGFGFHCGNNETMCDALRANNQEFWQNWSIVTGIPLPPGGEDAGHFSCAC